MSKEKFLLYMLAGIFSYQAAVFAFGLYQCSRVRPTANINLVCPELGKRYDTTFAIMISTTLALLTGNKLKE